MGMAIELSGLLGAGVAAWARERKEARFMWCKSARASWAKRQPENGERETMQSVCFGKRISREAK